MYACLPSVCIALEGAEEGDGSLGIGVKISYKLPCRWWEPNLGSQLLTDSSLQIFSLG